MRRGVVRSGREAARGGRVFAAGLLLLATGAEATAQGELSSALCGLPYLAERYAEAVKPCREAAEAGDAVAMFNLGVMYHKGRGVPQDYAQALFWFRKAAEKGVPAAMNNLGVMYDNGQGVAQDYAQALHWYRKAAEAGSADAMFNLGLMYLDGRGVPQNDAQALHWYRKAAEAGDAGAMFNLGVMYHEGRGVPQDDAQALFWFRKAAEKGVPAAMNNLGFMYDNGRGVPQDYAQALHWYRKAAEAGHAGAMNNLGVMYEFGQGVRRDLVQAHLWYNLAAARETDREGREGAVRNRDRVAARLGPEELARAQRLARDWRPGTATAALPPGPSLPMPAPVEPEPSPALVQEVQRRLAALGYDPGPADGVAGARTRAAVRAFERARGLPESGRIDGALLDRLRAAAGAAPGPAPTVPAPAGRSGSGIFVSADGVVLTNAHVVRGCRRLEVEPAEGAPRRARLLGEARGADLALLATDAPAPAVAAFRTTPPLRPGEAVTVFGWPLSGLLASRGVVATGTVAALAGPGDDPSLFQIQAPVQPGNSGGPVVDAQGRVLGVVVAKLDALKVAQAIGDIPQNVNFAIKGSIATSFLESRGVLWQGAEAGGGEPAAVARVIAARVVCTP